MLIFKFVLILKKTVFFFFGQKLVKKASILFKETRPLVGLIDNILLSIFCISKQFLFKSFDSFFFLFLVLIDA